MWNLWLSFKQYVGLLITGSDHWQISGSLQQSRKDSTPPASLGLVQTEQPARGGTSVAARSAYFVSTREKLDMFVPNSARTACIYITRKSVFHTHLAWLFPPNFYCFLLYSTSQWCWSSWFAMTLLPTVNYLYYAST